MKKVIAFLVLVFSQVYAFNLERVDVLYSYEYLTPNSTYGTWNSIEVMSYWKWGQNTTPFLGGTITDRSKEGGAFLSTLGAYRDWSEFLYTYSAVSFGSNSTYYPQYRLDHDFNFKVGRERNIVLTIGGSYIKYWDVHKDKVFSLGGTVYSGKFVGSLRYFYNISDPGNVTSSSYLVSVGYGAEKESWTYLDVYLGKQAYLATYLYQPEQVNQNAYIIELNHRQWVRNDAGFIVIVGYMKLEDGYEKYRISGGFFKEF
ncbi:YaiO family outer membrane beta-barrel protein [Persephonella sp.]